MMFIRRRTCAELRLEGEGIAKQPPALAREQGQGLVEYALIISVAVMLGVGGYSAAGANLQGMLSRISSGTAAVQPPSTTSMLSTTTVATTTTKKKKQKSH